MGSLVEVAVGAHPGVTLLATPGYTERTIALGARIAAARTYLAGLFAVEPEVRALVCDEVDWREHCPFPDYGMPFSQPPGSLYAAATDNDLWRAAVRDLATLPPPVAGLLTAVYTESDGFSARRLFDLLVVHELAHLFEHAGGARFPRRWLRELFCNLALHAYVEAQEPDQLAALATLPEVVAGVPVDLLPHHTLREWEELFENVGPFAFAWYQCRLHRAAATIHTSRGSGAVRAMWTLFTDGPGAGAPEDVSDDDLLARLAERFPEVAAVATSWPGADR